MALFGNNANHLDPKTRRIWAAGTVCLFTSSALTLFGEGMHAHYPKVFQGLRGFLLGLALVFLLWTVRRKHKLDASS